MPKNKDIKRRVRARMSKTGESCTAARSQLLRRKYRSLPHDYEDLAGISDAMARSKRAGVEPSTWP